MCNFSICNELIFRRFCFLNWVVVPYCFFSTDDVGASPHDASTWIDVCNSFGF